MKNIYLIGGTMGVGKTTTCQVLKSKLPGSVFLDGDWCWDMQPFSGYTGDEENGNGEYLFPSESVYSLQCV